MGSKGLRKGPGRSTFDAQPGSAITLNSDYLSSVLCEGIVGVETAARLCQKGVQEMLSRFCKLVRNLRRGRQPQVPLVRREGEGLCSRLAAEAVHMIRTIEDERGMLADSEPIAEPLLV